MLCICFTVWPLWMLLCLGARICFHGNREQEASWPHLQNGKKGLWSAQWVKWVLRLLLTVFIVQHKGSKQCDRIIHCVLRTVSTDWLLKVSLLFVWLVLTQAAAAAVRVMKCLWVMMTRTMAPTSQHALLWLPFCPLSRRRRRGGPRKFSWKQQERYHTSSRFGTKDSI